MTDRLLLLGDSLAIGGTEGQFAEIACGLDRSRWEVDVSCLRAEGPLSSRLEAAGVRAWSSGPRSLKSPRAALAVLALARHLRRTGVRLLHSFDFYSNTLGVLAGRLARVPVVVASQRDMGNLRSPFQSRIHRAVLRLADHVLVNSPAVAERVEQGGVARGRITLIQNGVDVTRFHPAAPRPRGASAAVTVGTLANLRAEKGVLDLVRAAAIVCERCPHVRFALVGDGPLRGSIEALVRGQGLERSVELRGRTTEPARALRDLDVFVLASHSEAASNGLLEAMATGLAVVATNVGGNPGLVDDERTGLLVPPADPAGLAKAILRLVEDPPLAASLGRAALERIQADFTVPRMLGDLQSFYERGLAGRSR